jgi:hypothetical protein
MHPILTLKFLEFFLKSCEGEQRQIIVNTHESNLLDLELLRRDEIWFAEKGKEGATRLYSLAELKVWKDWEIRKQYLQGRFGAVPFLSGIDKLLAEEEASAWALFSGNHTQLEEMIKLFGMIDFLSSLVMIPTRQSNISIFSKLLGYKCMLFKQKQEHQMPDMS